MTDRIAVIDCHCLSASSRSDYDKVTPLETVLEGDFDQLMRILKEALAGQGADNAFANVKINLGEI